MYPIKETRHSLCFTLSSSTILVFLSPFFQPLYYARVLHIAGSPTAPLWFSSAHKLHYYPIYLGLVNATLNHAWTILHGRVARMVWRYWYQAP